MLRGFREHRRLGNPVENGIHGDFVFTEAQAKYRQLIRLKRRLYRNSARDTETNRYKGVAEGDAGMKLTGTVVCVVYNVVGRSVGSTRIDSNFLTPL